MANQTIAPVTVTSPDGTIHEPVALTIGDEGFTVTDKHGTVIHEGPYLSYSSGRRVSTIDTADGRWTARTLCSCSSRLRALRAEWERAQAAA